MLNSKRMVVLISVFAVMAVVVLVVLLNQPDPSVPPEAVAAVFEEVLAEAGVENILVYIGEDGKLRIEIDGDLTESGKKAMATAMKRKEISDFVDRYLAMQVE